MMRFKTKANKTADRQGSMLPMLAVVMVILNDAFKEIARKLAVSMTE